MKDSEIEIRQTVEQLIKERWLRPATVAYYRQIQDRWLEDMGISNLSVITTEDIISWREMLKARACTVTTINTYHRGMRAIINFAMEKKWVSYNPFNEIKTIHVGKRLKKTLDDSLVDRSLKLLDRQGCTGIQPGFFWQLVIKTFYYTGIRRSQLAGLRWGDVNFEKQLLIIRARTSKTDREWLIPIAPKLLSELDSFRRKTQERLMRWPRAEEQLFRIQLWDDRYAGSELSKEQIGTFFRRLADRLGQPVSAHRFRHTFATHLARHDLKSAQEILGHTNLKTTMEYVHPDLEQMQDLLRKLPDI